MLQYFGIFPVGYWLVRAGGFYTLASESIAVLFGAIIVTICFPTVVLDAFSETATLTTNFH